MASDDDVYTALNDGLALYHARRYFDAHELWEATWLHEVGRTKLVLQALIQIATALYKHEAGVPAGTSKLLDKAKEKLAEARNGASAWLGIDLVALSAEVERALAEADRVAAGAASEVTPPALPRVVGRDGVVYLHGFASGPSSSKAKVLVTELRRLGHHVAVPDLNEGDFEHLTVTRALALVARNLRERTLVVGSSMGGYLAALTAARDERVKGLVLMAPAFDFAPRMRSRYGDDALRAWQRLGATIVEHYAWGTKERIGYGLVADAEKHPPRPPLRVPTYVLHGHRDEVVPASISEEVARGAPPGLVELDLVDDDHALAATAPRALEAARRMIARLQLEPEPPESDVGRVLTRLALAGRD